MYRSRIQSNLGRKRGRYQVPRLEGAQNAKEMKARCREGIAKTEGGITMASGIRSMNWEIMKISRGRRDGWAGIVEQSQRRQEYVV